MDLGFRKAVTTFVLAALSLSAAASGDGTSAKLRASAASAAQDVYHYIATRPQNATNGFILGQHLGSHDDLGGTFDESNHGVMDNAGYFHFPGMVGARYDDNDKVNGGYDLDPGQIADINAQLIRDWNQYHSIIAITATPRNPWNQNKGRDPSGMDRSLADLAYANRVEGTPAGNFWDDIDTIADGLEQLKDQGIPVVFRPFAEFNINKYYGPDGYDYHANRYQQPGDFQSLWSDVYTHLVVDRGLNNVIFCWEAWVLNRNQSESSVQLWFPSATQVDIVSGAYYFSDSPPYNYFSGPNGGFSPQNIGSHYDLTTQNHLINDVAEFNNKPFGVAQWGLNASSTGPNCSSGGDWHNAVNFYNSVTNAVGAKRTAFVYHWVGLCAVESQVPVYPAGSFVSDPNVATNEEVPQVINIKGDATGGWVLESAVTPGHGGKSQTVAGPLLMGENSSNLRYRSILNFGTNAIHTGNITSVTLRLHQNTAQGFGDPYGVFPAPTVDIVPNSGALSAGEFQVAAKAASVAAIGNPADDAQRHWAEASLTAGGITYMNNTPGITRMRVYFPGGPLNLNADTYVAWYSGDSSSSATDYPQLIVTYTP